MIVQTVADELGISNFQVEKDYFVSLVLKKLQKFNTNNKIVFKGGTSLLKCYGVIERFSEDIDLSVRFNTDKVTTSERNQLKEIILNTIDNLGLMLLNKDDVKSRKDFNRYEIGYNNVFDYDEAVVRHIIVETIVVYNPFPVVQMEVNNYISKYLSENNRADLLEKYEIAPFLMPIQKIERTFIDKLFAICDYHLQKKYNRHSRHIYDIHKIWTSGLLDDNMLSEIILDIVKDRQLHGNHNISCQPGMRPQKIIEESISTDSYKDDYNSTTSKLIHTHVEYKTCINTLKTILDQKILPSKIDEF